MLLINGDSLCAWPLRRLLRRHLAAGARATLMLTTCVDPAGFGGGVGVDRQGRIRSFFVGDRERGEVARRAVFAGAHVLDPRLLERVEAGPADIVRGLYMPLLDEGETLLGVPSRRRWHDLGTPRRYLEGALDWCRGSGPPRLWRRSWIHPEARVESGAVVRASVLEAGAEVGAGARVERSLLLPGARIAGGAVVSGSVVGFDASLPRQAHVDSRLVNAARDGLRLEAVDSQVAGLVYTPLDVRRRRENPGL